ncbi:hypothetical protein DPEC_G00007710 [Dallia pectoralis]|uniref:Uncharacterized protein n=1 Tax=Dallia pectoralis TaxID=75939 RepID=A0ACC2HKB2_DALPE|nr:hypothetical protein DPEC_G00007710 [Dallia pectoralis]
MLSSFAAVMTFGCRPPVSHGPAANAGPAAGTQPTLRSVCQPPLPVYTPREERAQPHQVKGVDFKRSPRRGITTGGVLVVAPVICLLRLSCPPGNSSPAAAHYARNASLGQMPGVWWHINTGMTTSPGHL